MFNRTALLTAVATVTLSVAGSAMAQLSTIPYDATRDTNVPDKALRTGATDSLGVVQNTARNDNELKQPAVWKGQRAQNQRLNVGNSLPERTVFGNVGDIDNSNTGTMNRLPSGEILTERRAVVASETIEPAPAPVVEQRTVVTQQPVVRQEVREERVVATDGIDHRFLKPADPAVVNPDYKMNAGIDRTLAQDKNLYGRDVQLNNYRATDETAIRDVSNHPIDSLNDARFKGPAIPDDELRAVPASERMTPDTKVTPDTSSNTYVAPAPQSNTVAPAVTPATPARPDEYQSTWSSESDRMAKDDNAVRPYRNPDKDQPAPMKGERALNALDNTRNPVPDKTIFGKTGDIRSNGPTNNAGDPLNRSNP